MRKIICTAKTHGVRRAATTVLMMAALSGLALTLSPAAMAATSAEPKSVPQLAQNAPERYKVLPGDTLWGIASKFLKDPYRWGDVYQQNKADIKNPHWIYPGQMLVLERNGAAGGLPTIKLEPREYVEAIKQPVWTVAPDAIANFMSKPLVVEKGELDSAARIVGLQDNRVLIGAGDQFYVANVEKAQRDWQVFKLGDPLTDPDTKEELGHEAIFLGSARQLTEGVPATFILRSSTQEVAPGAYLLPTPAPSIADYTPRAPAKDIKGRVLGLSGGVGFAGKSDVISINKGKADGVELGHVLAIDRAGDKVDDRYQGTKTSYTLPDQRNGLIFIFRVFDRVSYGLIMESARPVQRGDSVRAPSP